MNETCVYPWWASRQKLHVIVLWVPATPWGFVSILKKKRDFRHHWRRQARTSAQNIPLKIAFNMALKTIFGSGNMWCNVYSTWRVESCIVTVTQNQRLYHFMKISRCVKTHQDSLTGPQASLHMVIFEKSRRASSYVHWLTMTTSIPGFLLFLQSVGRWRKSAIPIP